MVLEARAWGFEFPSTLESDSCYNSLCVKMTSLRTTVLPIVHKDTHEAISPSRAELSQAGKTVLVTGGAYGVGYAIANSFAQARASTIVLVGRHVDTLQSSAEKLKADSAKVNPDLRVVVHKVDVTSHESTVGLWRWLAEQKVVIDVLILNAGRQSPFKSILDLGLDEVWNFYQVNVYGHMDFAQHFHKQDRRGSKTSPVRVNIIHLNSVAEIVLTLCAP